jgi:hypothetical protein
MQDNDAFDRILKARPVPEMRTHLPERIIEASLKTAQRKPNVAVSWAVNFWDCFALPRPVLVMGVALVIGVVVGLSPRFDVPRKTDFYEPTQIQADLGDML